MNDIKKLKDLAQNYSVLYVEDDKDIQKSMETYLKKLFKDVKVADDGVEGLNFYENNIFDIVITDLSMPNMNGLDMISEIRLLNFQQIILITSAHEESNYLLGAIKSGTDGYIIKPFDFEQLNNELFKIVDKLHKFKEAKLYKEYLENSIDKRSAILSSVLQFQNENYEDTLYSMVEMIEDRDTYTAGHSHRVATYSKMIAEDMGYCEDDCTKIFQAGMLHDIGKVATPDAVLLNPTQLSDIEYNLIKEHVNVGYKLLSHIPMFEPLAEIIHSHHERYDGNGYPRGVSKDDISPLSRIMIVADAFDAMTTNRIYKGRKSVDEAIAEIELLSKKQFHPEVVEVAKHSLKKVIIDENINQLPKSKLEEKRFAYFYKDILTDIYNKSYLDLLLIRNSYEKKYKYMGVIFLKNFSLYNKDNSWSSGDKLLNRVAKTLKIHYSDSILFRVFGDDFVLLSEEKISFSNIKDILDDIISDTCVKYIYKVIDLDKVEIVNANDIENIIR